MIDPLIHLGRNRDKAEACGVVLEGAEIGIHTAQEIGQARARDDDNVVVARQGPSCARSLGTTLSQEQNEKRQRDVPNRDMVMDHPPSPEALLAEIYCGNGPVTAVLVCPYRGTLRSEKASFRRSMRNRGRIVRKSENQSIRRFKRGSTGCHWGRTVSSPQPHRPLQLRDLPPQALEPLVLDLRSRNPLQRLDLLLHALDLLPRRLRVRGRVEAHRAGRPLRLSEGLSRRLEAPGQIVEASPLLRDRGGGRRRQPYSSGREVVVGEDSRQEQSAYQKNLSHDSNLSRSLRRSRGPGSAAKPLR